MYIYEFSYKFDTVLYQFFEIGTSDITFMSRDQELNWLAFNLYALSFFLYSPFKPSPWTNFCVCPWRLYLYFALLCVLDVKKNGKYWHMWRSVVYIWAKLHLFVLLLYVWNIKNSKFQFLCFRIDRLNGLPRMLRILQRSLRNQSLTGSFWTLQC